MYKLIFLDIALKDLNNIIYYISYDLKNPSAAKNLANNFIESINKLLEFPTWATIYEVKNKTNNEYRSVIVKNYRIFYTIDEKNKTVTIIRILYKKMNIIDILKSYYV